MPEWANQSKSYYVKINGKRKVIITGKGSHYLHFSRKWKKGDVVTFNLPMQVAWNRSPTRKTIMPSYGPIVLASSTGTEHLDGLYADDSRGGHIAHGKQIPLQEVPALIGSRFNPQFYP